uniref:Uncharacterized protein n=1 Tax=Anguilla anguilla TaxID=7936 RepID=A0A0E9XJZ4_ANGAN
MLMSQSLLVIECDGVLEHQLRMNCKNNIPKKTYSSKG